MLLEVSSGEGFDKLSVLEIKYSQITEADRRDDVQREIQALSDVFSLRAKYPIQYESIMKINKEIWDLTEVLDSTHPLFAKASERIFELNRKRYRVKKMINNSESSYLKEQKSTANSHCVIELDIDEYSRIPEIYSIAFDYDTLSFDRPTKLQPLPNFTQSAPEGCFRIPLSKIPRVSEDILPVSYGCGGKLGDMIHQLSVVKETYSKTGRKAAIYMSDYIGDKYERGALATLDDIREVFMSQPYIQSMDVHRGESYEINLSKWREHQTEPARSWKEMFQEAFGTPWNTEPWMNVTPNLQYQDTVFLAVGIYRYNHVLRYQEIVNRIPNIVFLCTNIDVYETFKSKTGIEMLYLVCPTFTDLASVISGCKGLIGSLSMSLALADAMWKPRLAIMYGVDFTNTVAMKTDNRFLLYTEDLDAFGWTVPDHLQSDRM